MCVCVCSWLWLMVVVNGCGASHADEMKNSERFIFLQNTNPND